MSKSIDDLNVESCRDCIHRRIFDDGRDYCPLYNIGPSHMPRDGCLFGSNKKFFE